MFHDVLISVAHVLTLLLALLFVYPLFFFNAPATTEIYTLSLHDALPILHGGDLAQPLGEREFGQILIGLGRYGVLRFPDQHLDRSEEHTSELQSRSDLVCRLLLEKKKKKEKTKDRM